MSAQRQLGLGSATALVVASMIGTGVFTTSGFLLADLRSPWVVIGAWAVGGMIAMLGAVSYGALARRIPESGGEYTFLSRTLHPAAGYVAGWVSLLVGFSAPLAAAAFAFGQYAKPWCQAWPPPVSGTLLIIAFGLLHASHVRGGAWVQNAAVLLKVVLILCFAGFACSRMGVLEKTEFEGASISAFGVSLVWIFFSYSGWNAAVYIGGEVRDPERNLPRALLAGTVAVTLVYLALNAVFVFGAPREVLAGRLEVGRIVAEHLGGPGWADLVAALVALVLVSSISSLIMAGPRVYARMAEDGYLPHWLRAQRGTPRTAIALQSGLALLLLWSATYESLLTYIGVTLSLSTAATIGGLVRLRCREGSRFRVPGWPWVPTLFLVSVAVMTLLSIIHRPVESLVGVATIGLGLLAWEMSRRLRPTRSNG